ncbi:hypothetical protein [Micromonospora sp. NPDC005367]|uniref:hypothetical protein n=1 Tax=Micromonospora sp. NPDC005367 TaxID=3155590 RepID=UPI0033B0AD64
MADTGNLQQAINWAALAPKQTELDAHSALAQTATAYAIIAVAQELQALRKTIESLRTAVTDQDGFSSADHLRAINEWVERIAKSN